MISIQSLQKVDSPEFSEPSVPQTQQNIPSQPEDAKLQSASELSASSDESEVKAIQSEDNDDDNQKFFTASQLSRGFIDLKASWLGNTEEVLRKYSHTEASLQEEHQKLKEKLNQFDEREVKINQRDPKQNKTIAYVSRRENKELFRQWTACNRKPIEELGPWLTLKVASYLEENIFGAMFHLRRVSRVFDRLYRCNEVMDEISIEQLGKPVTKAVMIEFWRKWLLLQKTFLYYKSIQYSENVSQNSFRDDLYNAVCFINEIHRWVYTTGKTQIAYLRLLNNFMRTHRVVMGLSSLSLTQMALVRKAAVIAFSNYLAFNPQERRKDEITKTKYSKVIQVIETEAYKCCLLVNTWVSNYLFDTLGITFAVFVAPYVVAGHVIDVGTFCTVFICHRYDQAKHRYMRSQVLTSELVLRGEEETVGFASDFSSISLRVEEEDGTLMEHHLDGCWIPTVSHESEDNKVALGQCLLYSSSQYFVIVKEDEQWF